MAIPKKRVDIPFYRQFVEFSTDAEQFSLKQYITDLAGSPESFVKLCSNSEGRKFLTRNNALAFALIYFMPKISHGIGRVSFADFHLETYRTMSLEWVKDKDRSGPRGQRDAYQCPRAMGKTSTLIDIGVTWSAAHQHHKFVMLFSDSADQAKDHLRNFREELKNNVKLRADYPELCNDTTDFETKYYPAISTEDKVDSYRAKSGFQIRAKGFATSSLGAKNSNQRPDFLLFDDILKGSSSLSVAKERQEIMVSNLFPLEESARVVIVGTSFQPGDLIHELKRAAENPSEAARWIREETISSHYYPPFIRRDDGSMRSCWADKWSMEWLLQNQNTRSFARKFANEPVPEDGTYWNGDHFPEDGYGELSEYPNVRILYVDPAVKSGPHNDFTAIAVVNYSEAIDMFEVAYSTQIKYRGPAMRELVLSLIEEHSCRAIIVETNQGGDLYTDEGGVFHDMPITVITEHVTENKLVRAARALNEYDKKKVKHVRKFPELEAQMLSLSPKSLHDDMVDSVSNAINYVRKAQKNDVSGRSTVRRYA
jgi:phage terminase large subunit-like protein